MKLPGDRSLADALALESPRLNSFPRCRRRSSQTLPVLSSMGQSGADPSFGRKADFPEAARHFKSSEPLFVFARDSGTKPPKETSLPTVIPKPW